MKKTHPKIILKKQRLFLLLCVLCVCPSSWGNDIATLRQGTPLDVVNTNPAPLGNAANDDIRKARAYPMQPPTIPHKIDGYQIDLNVNQCMSCHARKRVEESQAPMISVTHYMDRDGNFLAEVSPRRYFCTQCHVTQVSNKPLVNNTFIDMHDMPTQKSGSAHEAKK
jgi:cytochrome c-type protein NapB